MAAATTQVYGDIRKLFLEELQRQIDSLVAKSIQHEQEAVSLKRAASILADQHAKLRAMVSHDGQ